MDSRLTALQQLMRGYSRPWWVCGGCAVDLHLGRVTREHKDIEICIPCGDLPMLRECFGHAPCEIVGKEATGQPVLRELRPDQSAAAGEHELYFTLPDFGRLEVLLDETDPKLWRYRRDPRVTLPLARFGLVNADGIPYVTPEVLLLYKAKGTRPLDEQDFAALLPALEAKQLVWLADSIWLAHSGHPWGTRLTEALAKAPGRAIHRRQITFGCVILVILAVLYFLAFGLVAPSPK